MIVLLNDARQILSRLTLVAMATKFETPTLGSKTANINVKKLNSLKLIVRTILLGNPGCSYAWDSLRTPHA